MEYRLTEIEKLYKSSCLILSISLLSEMLDKMCKSSMNRYVILIVAILLA